MGLIVKLALALALGVGGERAWAVRYAPGVMERVSRTRGLPIVGCMIAHPRMPIGSWLYISGIRTKASLWCRVTDTSQPQDRARHIASGRIELDYGSSKLICGTTWQGAARECPVRISKEHDR